MEWTRLTVRGTHAVAEIVLPDDEPVADLLPSVLELLGEPPTDGRPLTLTTVLGVPLDPAATLAELGTPHGTVTRLVRADDVPPPPEVADVTDVTAQLTQGRIAHWTSTHTTVLAGVVAALAGLLLGALSLTPSPEFDLLGGAWLGAGVLALGALVTAALHRTAAAAVLTAAACGLVLVPSTTLSPTGPDVLLWWAVGSGTLAGAVAALRLRHRAPLTGPAVALVLSALWAGLAAAGSTPVHTLIWVVVAGTAVVGLLPVLAVTSAGLTALRDRAALERVAAVAATDRAHLALTTAAFGAAVPTAVAAVQLTLTGGVWGRALAGAVALVLVLRTLVTPMPWGRAALWAAGLAIGLAQVSVTMTAEPGTVAIIAVVVLISAVLAVAVPTSDYRRARLRTLAGQLEVVAVIALLPLALAGLGVFTDLMETLR